MIIALSMDPDANTIYLDCDKDGTAYLIQRLNVLLEHGDHEHLMTESWGGWELTDGEFRPATMPVHHLQITVVD